LASRTKSHHCLYGDPAAIIDVSFKIVPLLRIAYCTRRKAMEGNTGGHNGEVIIGSRSVTLWQISSLCNETRVWIVVFLF